ncbi:MFS transporter [Tengunoibacter tsumagoiensis]|uniref:Major facilitator superfamily (MFS) profile domain-containing protein n=1 Tax=Tengunoibacter tsumagoiensis TaxID=2014871 RepID=A0A401ZZV7_9CHLR|nr:MFS transporter [Tengunoibacter tsumagoiensis]GCE12408.1 hypothetical protein KTT_22670 [Tengunoibacter tsumagoiensis]
MFVRSIFARLSRRKVSAYPLLLCMGLIDEVSAGIPVVALPLLRDHLGLSYAQIGLLFTVAALSSMLLEPLMNLYSDRGSKKRWILCGLLVLATTDIIIGNATIYLVLLLAFILSAPAGKAAIGLSQATVIDAAFGEETRTMTRWTLLSGIGDSLSPLLVATFVTLRLGWTELYWLMAISWLSVALLLAPLRFPTHAGPAVLPEKQDKASPWSNLRDALRDPLLVRWAALSLIPTMLDEVFLGFVALYLRDIVHISEAGIALIMLLQMLSSFVGLLLLDRVLKRRNLRPVHLLTLLALTTLLGMVVLLFAHTLWLTILALLVISGSCAGWYPIAKAEAYACRPGSSGLVRTVISLGAPFEMALPGAIGLISLNFGVLAGLGVLGLAPLLMLALLPYRQER